MQERLERLPDPLRSEGPGEYVAALEQFEAETATNREETLKSAKDQLDQAQKELNEQLDEAEPHAPAKVQKVRREADARFEALRRVLTGEPPPEDAPPSGDGPPKPQAPGALAALREAKKEPDPTTVQMLEDGDVQSLEMYRGSAHYRPPARLLDPEAQQRARSSALELRAAGKSFAELDWTRYDLSALDLQDAECRRTLLEEQTYEDGPLASRHVRCGARSRRRSERPGSTERCSKARTWARPWWMARASREPTCARPSSLAASSCPSRSEEPTSRGWTGSKRSSVRWISRGRRRGDVLPLQGQHRHPQEESGDRAAGSE